MLIAKEKRKTNIAEYLIYMWQVEDIVRAYSFDIELIEKDIISKYEQPEDIRKEIRFWYENLIETMKKEKVENKGHIQQLVNLIDDLTDLHLFLLKSPLHLDYRNLYFETSEILIDFHSKLVDKNITEVEVSFQALYSVFLLRLQKKEISSETEKAISKIGKLMALLSKKYHERENEKLKM